MPELIDRQAAIKLLNEMQEKASTGLEDVTIYRAINALREMPTIEPEVRHGHWENIPGMNNTVFCSECLAAANKELAMKYKGCPFCLAQMDGGADNA